MLKCKKCGEPIGLLAVRYEYRTPIKPKGFPHRWKLVGYHCESCGEKKYEGK